MQIMLSWKLSHVYMTGAQPQHLKVYLIGTSVLFSGYGRKGGATDEKKKIKWPSHYTSIDEVSRSVDRQVKYLIRWSLICFEISITSNTYHSHSLHTLLKIYFIHHIYSMWTQQYVNTFQLSRYFRFYWYLFRNMHSITLNY